MILKVVKSFIVVSYINNIQRRQNYVCFYEMFFLELYDIGSDSSESINSIYLFLLLNSIDVHCTKKRSSLPGFQ